MEVVTQITMAASSVDLEGYAVVTVRNMQISGICFLWASAGNDIPPSQRRFLLRTVLGRLRIPLIGCVHFGHKP
jgi:hypothetical protein